MLLYIVDKNNKTLCALSSNFDSHNSFNFYNDKWSQYLKTPSTFEFSCLGGHKNSEHVTVGNQVIFKYEDEYHLFLITEVEHTHSDTNEMRVYCEHASLSLLNSVVLPSVNKDINLEDTLEILLADTDFKVGTVEYMGFKDYEPSGYPTVLEEIEGVAELFEAELKYRIEFNPSKGITGKFVDAFKSVGKDEGTRFVIGHNAQEVIKKVDFSTVCTAIIPYGDNDTTIGSITCEKAKHGFDKPSGQIFVAISEEERHALVGDRTDKHIFGAFNVSGVTDPTTIAVKGWEELQKIKEPAIEYTFNPILIKRGVHIGDTIKCIDREMNLQLEAKVNELHLSFTDSTQDEVVLTNYEVVESNISDEIRKIQQSLKNMEFDSDITVDNTMPSNPKDKDIWIDTSDTVDNVNGIISIKTWDEEKQQWVSSIDKEVLEQYPTNDEVEIMVETSKGTTITYIDNQLSNREMAVYKQDTMPTSGINGQLWLNTGVTPNVWYKYNGTTQQWEKLIVAGIDSNLQDVVSELEKAQEEATEKVNDANAKVDEIYANIETIEGDLTQAKNDILDKADKGEITAIDNRLTNTEIQVNKNTTDISTKVSTIDYELDKNSLTERIATAESNITQNANEISTKVTQAEINQAVDNLQIGGTNLARKTKDFGVYTENQSDGFLITNQWSNSNASITIGEDGFGELNAYQTGLTQDLWLAFMGSSWFECKKGDTITVSCEWKIDDVSTVKYNDADAPPLIFNIQGCKSDDTNRIDHQDVRPTNYTDCNGKWVKYSATHTFTIDDVARGRIVFYIHRNGTFHWRKLKVEFGNKATDWSPSPLDAEQDINDLGTRLSSAESTITQHADMIATKVTQTQVETITNNAINNIQIGGTNLLRNTTKTKVFASVTENGSNTWYTSGAREWFEHGIVMEEGYYTLSFDYVLNWDGCSIEKPTTRIGVGVGIGSSASAGGYSADTWEVIADFLDYGGSYDSGKFVKTFYASKTNVESTNGKYFAFRPLRHNDSGCIGLIVNIDNIQLEKGNKATDWSPSPDDVNGDIDALNTRITTTESSIVQHADEIATKVTQTQVETITNNAVDNIKIGGVNLASKEKVCISATGNTRDGYVYHLNATTEYAGLYIHNSLFEAGKFYTLSYKFRKTSGTLNNIGGHSGCFSNSAYETFYIDGVKWQSNYSSTVQNLGDDEEVHEVIFTSKCIRLDEPTPYLYIQPNRGNLVNIPVTIDVWDIQFEEGNKATDWKIPQADVTSDINNLGSRITTAESSITQHANEIATKVTQTEIDNAVDNIKIGGKNLLLKSDIDKYGLGNWINNGSTSSISLTNEVTYMGKKTIKIVGNNGIKNTQNIKLKPNTEYTYSMKFYTDTSLTINSSNPMHSWISTQQNTAQHLETVLKFYPNNGGLPANLPINEWTHVYLTFRTPSDSDVYYMIPFVYGISSATVYICEPQIEEGNKPTTWSQAQEDINTEVASLGSRITTAESSIVQQANMIATKVTQTEIDNSINALQIGGRNLLKNSKNVNNSPYATNSVLGSTKVVTIDRSTISSNYYDVSWTNVLIPEQNTEYTLSFYAKGDGGFHSYFWQSGVVVVASGYSNIGKTTTANDGSIYHELTSEYRKYIITWKTSNEVTGLCHILPIRVYKTDTSSTISAYGFKFEKGTKATDWTPAPEDVDSDISTLNNKVTTNTSSITQLSNEIQTKVTSSQVENIVNTAIESLSGDGRNMILYGDCSEGIIPRLEEEDWYSLSSNIYSDMYNGLLQLYVEPSTANSTETYHLGKTANSLNGFLADTYTFAFDIQILEDSDITLNHIRIGFDEYNGTTWHSLQPLLGTLTPISTNGNWQRFAITFTFNQSDAIIRIPFIRATGVTELTNPYFLLDNIKVEKGTEATVFTKNPNELTSAELSALKQRVTTAESNITQNANQIATKVSQTEYDTDMSGLTTRMSNAESTITQQGNLIATKVTETQVQTLIDNVEIGGTNILWNTNFDKTLFNKATGECWSNSANTVSYVEVLEKEYLGKNVVHVNNNTTNNAFDILQQVLYSTNVKKRYIENEQYTFSFYVKGSGTFTTYVYPQMGDGSHDRIIDGVVNGKGAIDHSYTWSLTSEWTRHTYTFTIADTLGSSRTSTSILFRLHKNSEIYIAMPQLERGNRATDYKESIDDANRNITTLGSRVTTAESTIVQHADRIATKVTQTEIDTAVNNIQIGGRNYLKNTSNEWATATFSGWQYYKYDAYSPTDFIDKTFVFSADIENVSGGVDVGLMLHVTTPDINIGYWQNVSTQKVSVGNQGKIIAIGTMISAIRNISSIQLALRHYSGTDGESTVKIRNAKLEIGNKATDWTPAPEDTDNEISALGTRITTAESSIVQNANNIATKVSQTTYNTDVNSLKSRMSSAESNITQNANNIATKVSQTDFNALGSRVTSAESKITQNTNNIALKVNQTDFDNLKIGGHNYLVNSKFDTDWDGWITSIGSNGTLSIHEGTFENCAKITSSALANTYYVAQDVLDVVEPNTQYTMSGWVKPDGITKGTTNFSLMFYCDGSYLANGTATWFGYGGKGVNATSNTWQHITFTFTTDDKIGTASNFRVFMFSRDFTGTFYFKKLKLETGKHATDWSDNNEHEIIELATRVNNAEIKLNDDSIISTVMNSETFALATDDFLTSADTTDFVTQTDIDNSITAMNIAGTIDSRIEDLISDPDSNLNLAFTTKAELTQTATDITANFSMANGLNLIKNSCFMAGKDHWSTAFTGIVGDASVESLGFGGYLDVDVTDKTTAQWTNQNNIPTIIGRTYTFSVYARCVVDGAGASTDSVVAFKIQENNNGTVLKDFRFYKGSVSNEWTRYTTTFTATTSQVEVCIPVYVGSRVQITGLMMHEGSVPLAWGLASGEVYNSNVSMNINGIQVNQLDSSGNKVGYTAITPNEFAGYNNNGGTYEKVFWINEDETTTKKLKATNEITMGTVKIVNINNSAFTGWAFTTNIDD